MNYTKYRWDYPSTWLSEKLDTARNENDASALWSYATELLRTVDEDTVQDAFQSEMDADGYFITEEDTKENNS